MSMSKSFQFFLVLTIASTHGVVAESSYSDLPVKSVLAFDTNMVWKYPFEGDTLYRLWSVTVGNRGKIEDARYTIYLDETLNRKVFQGTVINNEKVGKYTHWRTDGTIWIEADRSSNDGYEKKWKRDGTLEKRLTFNNGLITKAEKWVMQYDQQEVVRKTLYFNGKPNREIVSTRNGKPIEEIYYKKNSSDGSVMEYLSIELDTSGLVSSVWQYRVDTVTTDFEGKEFKLIQLNQVQLDSILNN